jgi:hypothetical protein
MSKNNTYRFPATALLNPQPRPTEKGKRIGLMFIDEKPCEVCGGPVADIHDKFCSILCVVEAEKIKQAEIARAEQLAAIDDARLQSIRASWRKYQRKNKAQRSEYHREWRKANADKENECRRVYLAANKEKVSERRRAYREANKTKLAEKKKIYYEANKQIILEKAKAKRAKS